MGDFNNWNIQWNTLYNTGVEDQQCMCIRQDNFLTYHVLEITRGARVLDLVLSSQGEFVDNTTSTNKNHWAAALIINCILISKLNQTKQKLANE